MPADVNSSVVKVPSPNYASATAFLNELSSAEIGGAKVLEVANIADVFHIFSHSDDPELQELAKKFENMARNWVGEWCCAFAPKGMPGHVAYDLFWDVEGHFDRARRLRTGEWRARLGHIDVYVGDCVYSGPKNYTVECPTARRGGAGKARRR